MTDELVARLRTLPPDLPDPDDRYRRVRDRVRRRTRRLAVAGTVTAVVLVATVVVPLTGWWADRDAPAAVPLACPAVHAGTPPWVPDQARGVDDRGRLVPTQTPTRVLVCAYRGQNTDPDQAGWPLSGPRQLTGGLDALAADLSLRPGKSPIDNACFVRGGPQTDFLLGLTYPEGTLWLSATQDPNQCVPTSNGRFTTGNLGDQVADAYRTGTWTAPPVTTGCDYGNSGRLGQESTMVPPGAVSALVCPTLQGVPSAEADPAQLASLTAALNALPTDPTDNLCVPITTDLTTSYRVVFGYPHGPNVTVRVHGNCVPAVSNSSIEAPDATTVLPLLREILG